MDRLRRKERPQHLLSILAMTRPFLTTASVSSGRGSMIYSIDVCKAQLALQAAPGGIWASHVLYLSAFCLSPGFLGR